MANSPIQIVLNSSDFVTAWERPAGGGIKDFYEGKDKEFVAHKTKLLNQLSALEERQFSNKYSDITYAKVILKQSGLAKSHRPTNKIFVDQVAPVVGAADLGEIYVELNSSSIQLINQRINQAESETRFRQKEVKGVLTQVPSPTELRSEVGAIDEIRAHTAGDKRKFSVDEALDWLSNPKSGGAYIIELFDAPPSPQNLDNISAAKRKLFKSFTEGLIGLSIGVFAAKINETSGSAPLFGIRLEEKSNKGTVHLMPLRSSTKTTDKPFVLSKEKEKHSTLLKFLEEHPLVKTIVLPPLISTSNKSAKVQKGEAFTVAKISPTGKYPKIGIVDGGVSNFLSDWVEARWGLISGFDKDEEHGTFIAGLAISGKSLNGQDICKELDGCKIIDLDLLPRDGLWENYYTEPLEFFRELKSAVEQLKASTGVRIFNFSLNFEEHVSTERNYSIPARFLDNIAEESDVIFIISVGNTLAQNTRKEWPSDNLSALEILAKSQYDTIKTPSESYRNLSVSAVNPPSLDGVLPHALSNYSCRGPGLRIGLKPDLAHIGGAGHGGNNGHGLYSLTPDGKIIDGCGTSYSTPIVAKTIACLDEQIEGDVSRESLMALAIHNAIIPDLFLTKGLDNIAKDLIGFGIPRSSDEILGGSDNAITLVFANRIYPKKRMSFGFSWPSSLVQNNKCFGRARLTLVSTPPFDHKYGAEFVRVNINASLRQQQKNGKYKGMLKPLYLPQTSSKEQREKNQISQSFKWSPIKAYESTFNGSGPTSDWRLDIEYLERDGERVPSEGIPFTALLTISDPEGIKPVFNEMRNVLQSQGVQILDIKTAARVLPRV